MGKFWQPVLYVQVAFPRPRAVSGHSAHKHHNFPTGSRQRLWVPAWEELSSFGVPATLLSSGQS
jgi:hypothetical protein